MDSIDKQYKKLFKHIHEADDPFPYNPKPGPIKPPTPKPIKPDENEEEKEPTESSKIGRVFEFKKIFIRLSVIKNLLISAYDPQLLKIQEYIDSAIELFDVVVSNINSYEDKLDKIIIDYYDFINRIYELLDAYYKKHKNTEDEENAKHKR